MKLEINPNNRKYYSEEFIKGFECGVERQFNADMEEKTAVLKKVEKITHHYECSNCNERVDGWDKYCRCCGYRLLGVKE